MSFPYARPAVALLLALIATFTGDIKPAEAARAPRPPRLLKGTLNVNVVDANNTKVIGLEVKVECIKVPPGAPPSTSKTVRTAGTSRRPKPASLKSLPRQYGADYYEYDVSTETTTHIAKISALKLTRASTTITLRLSLKPPTTGELNGTVRDASSGQPIAGATVQLNSLTATTSSTGAYAFSNLNPGAYDLFCNKTGFVSFGPETLQIQAGPAATRNIVLAAAPTEGVVSGIITTTAGSPLGGAVITVGTKTATTAADGLYSITGLSPGSNPIQVTRWGCEPVTGDTVNVTAGQTTSKDVVMSALYVPTLSVSSQFIDGYVEAAGLAYGPTDNIVYVADEGRNRIDAYNTSTLAKVNSWATGFARPNNVSLYTGSGGPALFCSRYGASCWITPTGATPGPARGFRSSTTLPDGRIAATGDDRLWILDNTGIVSEFIVNSGPFNWAIAGDGDFYYVATDDGQLRIIDNAGNVIKIVTIKLAATNATWVKGTNAIMIGYGDGTVEVYDRLVLVEGSNPSPHQTLTFPQGSGFIAGITADWPSRQAFVTTGASSIVHKLRLD